MRATLTLLYWAIMVCVLRRPIPVWMDSAGPMPSFAWQKMPTPAMAEYRAHESYYDRMFVTPYLVAALVITVVGCRVAPRLTRTAIRSAVCTLAVLLLISVASDPGIFIGFWTSPRILLHEFDPHSILLLATVFGPAVLMSAVVELTATPATSNAQSTPPGHRK